MVECIRTVHLHSAAVLPEEVLWSNASAQFICTLQPCCPRRFCGLPVVKCIRRVHLHHAASPLSARVRTRHKLAGTGFSYTLQPFSPRG